MTPPELPELPDEVRVVVAPVMARELRELAKLSDRQKRGTFRDVLRRRAEEWEAGR